MVVSSTVHPLPSRPPTCHHGGGTTRAPAHCVSWAKLVATHHRARCLHDISACGSVYGVLRRCRSPFQAGPLRFCSLTPPEWDSPASNQQVSPPCARRRQSVCSGAAHHHPHPSYESHVCCQLLLLQRVPRVTASVCLHTHPHLHQHHQQKAGDAATAAPGASSSRRRSDMSSSDLQVVVDPPVSSSPADPPVKPAPKKTLQERLPSFLHSRRNQALTGLGLLTLIAVPCIVGPSVAAAKKARNRDPLRNADPDWAIGDDGMPRTTTWDASGYSGRNGTLKVPRRTRVSASLKPETWTSYVKIKDGQVRRKAAEQRCGNVCACVAARWPARQQLRTACAHRTHPVSRVSRVPPSPAGDAGRVTQAHHPMSLCSCCSAATAPCCCSLMSTAGPSTPWASTRLSSQPWLQVRAVVPSRVP